MRWPALSVLGTITETAIAASYREGAETFYAAEAGVEFVIDELAAVDDWETLDEDGASSAFTDGPPAGTRHVGAVTLDLAAATQDVVTEARDQGNDVQYHLYVYGRLADMVQGVAPRSPVPSSPSGLRASIPMTRECCLTCGLSDGHTARPAAVGR